MARRPGRSYGLAGALAQRARLRQHRDEPEAAREDAVACAAVAERGGFPYFQAVGTMVRGWAAGALGDPGAGLEDLRAGLAAHAATGAAMDRPYFLALLAETLDRAGRRDEAVATIDEALAALPDGRPFYYEAELWRLRGELADDAEAARRAVAVARRQGAVALERRAAATLAARNLHTGST